MTGGSKQAADSSTQPASTSTMSHDRHSPSSPHLELISGALTEISQMRAGIAAVESSMAALRSPQQHNPQQFPSSPRHAKPLVTRAASDGQLLPHGRLPQLHQQQQRPFRSPSPALLQGLSIRQKQADTTPRALTPSYPFADKLSPTASIRSRKAESPVANEPTLHAMMQEPVQVPSSFKVKRKGLAAAGREAAMLLEEKLEQLVPEGAILAQARQSKHQQQDPQAGGDAAPGAANARAAAAVLQHFEALDALMQEAANRVAVSCVEQGRVLEALRGRYAELCNVLHLVAHDAASNAAAWRQHAHAAEAALAAERDKTAGLLLEVVRGREEIADLALQLDTAGAHYDELETEAIEQVARLLHKQQVLKAEAEHLQEALEHERRQHEVALSDAVAEANAAAEAAQEETDDMLQRMLFMEQRMALLRSGAPMVDTRNSSCQTDAEKPPAKMAPQLTVVVPPPEAPPVVGPKSTRGRASKATAVADKRQHMGDFEGLIRCTKRGRVRGRLWLVKTLGNIYADKLVADAVDDRVNAARTALCPFLYHWHLTKYGLRQMAEENLLDLIATATHHAAAACTPARWFARFTSLPPFSRTSHQQHADVSDAVSISNGSSARGAAAGMRAGGTEANMGTAVHLDFYLFVLQQLAYPAAVIALFPDTEDGPHLLKDMPVQEALKAIFRYLHDPEGVSTFVAKRLEAAAMSDATAPDKLFNADALIGLLMEELQRRRDRNTAELKALFRAGDVHGDGLSYEAFAAVLQLAQPDIQAHQVARMFFAALELTPRDFASTSSRAPPDSTASSPAPAMVPTTPAGQLPSSGGEHVCCDAFVAVAQANGLDHWCIDTAPATTPLLRAASCGGSLLARASGITAGGARPSLGGSVLSRPSMGGGTGSPDSSTLGSPHQRVHANWAASTSSNQAAGPGTPRGQGTVAAGDRQQGWRLPDGDGPADAADSALAGAVRSKMMVALESTLLAMQPPLEAQIAQLRAILGGSEEMQRIEQRAAHLAAKMAPQEGGRAYAAGAWLALRLLMAAMEGHTARLPSGPSRMVSRMPSHARHDDDTSSTDHVMMSPAHSPSAATDGSQGHQQPAGPSNDQRQPGTLPSAAAMAAALQAALVRTGSASPAAKAADAGAQSGGAAAARQGSGGPPQAAMEVDVGSPPRAPSPWAQQEEPGTNTADDRRLKTDMTAFDSVAERSQGLDSDSAHDIEVDETSEVAPPITGLSVLGTVAVGPPLQGPLGAAVAAPAAPGTVFVGRLSKAKSTAGRPKVQFQQEETH